MSMTPKGERQITIYVAGFIFSVALPRLSVHSRQLMLSPISQINTFYNFRHHTQTATLSDIYTCIFIYYVRTFCIRDTNSIIVGLRLFT